MAIDFVDAKALAEMAFKDFFQGHVSVMPTSWVRGEFFEENNCWLFLRSKDFEFDQSIPFSDFMVIVTGSGKVIVGSDRSENMDELRAHLKLMSNSRSVTEPINMPGSR